MGVVGGFWVWFFFVLSLSLSLHQLILPLNCEHLILLMNLKFLLSRAPLLEEKNYLDFLNEYFFLLFRFPDNCCESSSSTVCYWNWKLCGFPVGSVVILLFFSLFFFVLGSDFVFWQWYEGTMCVCLVECLCMVALWSTSEPQDNSQNQLMYLFFLFSQLQGSVWFYLPFYFVWLVTRYLWDFFFFFF